PDIALNLVCAGFDNRINHGSDRVAEFRAVVAALQLEFLYGIRDRHDANAAEYFLVIVDAVQAEIHLTGLGAVREYGPGKVLAGWCRSDAERPSYEVAACRKLC